MPNNVRAKIKLAHKPNIRFLNLSILSAVLIVILIIALLAGHSSQKTVASNGCGAYRDDRNMTMAGVTFKAEIASNSAEFNKGLGGRPCIMANQAMFFPFTKPGQYPFWMKGMKFSIDIIWIGSNQKVAGFYEDVAPSSFPRQFENSKDNPAQYVMEIKAGTVKSLKIKQGTPVSF